MALQTKTPPTKPVAAPSEPDLSLGWRAEYVLTPEGKRELLQIPLTPEERLHPQEDFVGPEPRLQDLLSDDICDMLRPHCAHDPAMVVARNLLIRWDDPALKTHAPDVCVIPDVRDSGANWGTFRVAEEGTRPCLIVEVVSPASKKDDRVTKVKHYARAGVQECVYIDYWQRKGQLLWEIAGFRLEKGHYVPMLPDEDGALYCETVGVRVGIEDGQVWMENYETGERLLTNVEREKARQASEAARQAAEARAAELEVQLRALQQERGETD